MTYEIYRYIFLGGAILSGIMLAVSVLLFFTLKIPRVIGDLTGANARKAIADIRSQNESTGNKAYQTSQVNRERGRITDKMTPSGRLVRRETQPLFAAMATEKIGTQQLEPFEPQAETAVLSQAPETAVLSGGNETTVLSNVQGYAPAEAVGSGWDESFAIEYELTFIHTQEQIG